MAEYPTRDEWEARRATAPAELLALAASAADLDDDRRRREAEEWDAYARLLADRRKGFEDALAALLADKGGAWLGAFRLDDATFQRPYRLGLEHRSWVALFDLAPVGFYPLRVELHYSHGHGRWFPPGKPFGVDLPPGTKWAATLAEAVRAAAHYHPCPF